MLSFWQLLLNYSVLTLAFKTISGFRRTFAAMKLLARSIYLFAIIALGIAQGGVFIESMTCLKSGSQTIAINSRINCCDAETSSSPSGIYMGCCCLHETTFVEQDNELVHTIPSIDITLNSAVIIPSVVEIESDYRTQFADLRNRPPPKESFQNLYCIYRI